MNTVNDKVDAVFRALSDSTRRVIVDELKARDGQTLFEICVRLIENHKLDLTRQAISKHLSVLESADLVRTSWNGRTKIHSINEIPIRKLGKGWLAKFVRKSEKKK